MMRFIAFAFAIALLIGLGWGVGQKTTADPTSAEISAVHAPPGVIAVSDLVAPPYEQAVSQEKSFLMVLVRQPEMPADGRALTPTSQRQLMAPTLARRYCITTAISTARPDSFMVYGRHWATPLNDGNCPSIGGKPGVKLFASAELAPAMSDIVALKSKVRQEQAA